MVESFLQSDKDVESVSTLISRNITVNGHRTSVRLEPEMWRALKEIASRENCSIHELCSLISFRKKPRTSLTAAIRVFLMLYFRAATTEDGHGKAGHGSFDSMKRRAGWHERSSAVVPAPADVPMPVPAAATAAAPAGNSFHQRMQQQQQQAGSGRSIAA